MNDTTENTFTQPSPEQELRAIAGVLAMAGPYFHGGESVRKRASEWLDEGFSAGDVERWTKVMVSDPHRAARVVDVGITPDDLERLPTDADIATMAGRRTDAKACIGFHLDTGWWPMADVLMLLGHDRDEIVVLIGAEGVQDLLTMCGASGLPPSRTGPWFNLNGQPPPWARLAKNLDDTARMMALCADQHGIAVPLLEEMREDEMGRPYQPVAVGPDAPDEWRQRARDMTRVLRLIE